MTKLQLLGLAAGRKAWRNVDPDDISGSWRAGINALTPSVTELQERAAVAASEYAAGSLAEQGIYRAPVAFVNPRGFAGQAPDGRSLQGLLYTPAVRAKVAIGAGLPVVEALESGRKSLDRMLRSVVADTARQAASVDIAARPTVGYVRVIVGETCRDCIVLAGKWYRWNEGFLRHPACDCVHEPATKALSADQVSDPYEHFNSLTREEQDALWGEADAQAIRDGADIYRVYNADRNRRGKPRMTTTAGVSDRRIDGRRLTPDGIYRIASDRGEALRLLEQHGYTLPGGQVPGGGIRGRYYESFGGADGGLMFARQTSSPRLRARDDRAAAVQRARRTGIRDPLNPDTMTAAERRLWRAQSDWGKVRQGVNPDRRDGKKLTPQISARVEKDYRRWLRTGGEVFTR